MAPTEYLEAWGTLIHEKNLKSKISCQTPFKGSLTRDLKKNIGDCEGRQGLSD